MICFVAVFVYSEECGWYDGLWQSVYSEECG